MQSAPIRLLLILLALAVRGGSNCCGLEPSSIEWLADYDQARRLGIEQQRPVFLFVTTDGCTYCEQMLDRAFQDVQVKADLKSRFVPAMLKLKSSMELAKQLKITIYPTTVIIGPDGKILDYARGYLDPSQLASRMSTASNLGSERIASVVAETR
jgi:thioredoxin-related protein